MEEAVWVDEGQASHNGQDGNCFPPPQPESVLQAVSNKVGGTGSSRNRELGRVGSQADLNRKHMGGKNWAQLGPALGIGSISDM